MKFRGVMIDAGPMREFTSKSKTLYIKYFIKVDKAIKCRKE